jgi:hypothetical protein
MKASKTTYGVAAVVFERLADDGWPDDAGWWPLGGRVSTANRPFEQRVQIVRDRSLSQFTKSLLRIGNRT